MLEEENMLREMAAQNDMEGADQAMDDDLIDLSKT